MRRGFPWSLLGIFLLVVVSFALPAFPQEVQAAGVALRLPFDGVYRMTAAFDHQYPNYTRDGSITIYTGESASDPNRCDPTATATYCYDGHNGYDWGMGVGTPVLAAADGIVEVARCEWNNYGFKVVVKHSNGYYTLVAHLSQINVQVGQSVRAGDTLGLSGSTGATCQSGAYSPHLHFTVYRGGYNSNDYATDPFGWRGSGADPLRDFGIRHTAECLWRGLPGDRISCFDHIVEDHYPTDGGGWSHGNSWDAVSGNNVWAHWTYTWATPTSWARWYPHGGGYNPISHHGFYRVYAFIPSTVGTRTRNAQYQVHYYPYGSVEPVSVDQSAIGDNWRYLTTREMEPNADYCYVYLDDYTGEGQRTRRVAADAVKFSAVETYLPTIRSTNGWTTYLHIRNLSESQPANVFLSYYRSDGTRWGSIPYTIPAKGTQTVISGGGFNGAAVVVSDQDVAVIVRREKGDRVAAYTGLSLTNWGSGWGQPGVEVYMPVTMYQVWGNWNSTLYVQNTSAYPASFTITYCRQGAPTACANESDTTVLPARGSAAYTPNEMGSGYAGPARIVSTQPLAVVVTQENPTWGISDYNALTYGAMRIYLPSLMNTWNSWTSSFTVQNIGASSTKVYIHYVRDDGTTIDRTYPNLAAGDAVVIVQNDPTYGVPEGWHGGARLTSDGPMLVAVVNQQRVDIQNHQSYSSLVGGGEFLYGPFAAKRYSAGGYCYNTASDVQNLDDSASTGVIRRYYETGGTWWHTTTSTTIPAEAVRSFYVPDEEGLAVGVYSLRVERDPAVAIAGIHNLARLDGACAAPTAGDYGAGYNMPQR